MKSNVPTAEGVPEINPVAEFRLNPVGKLPAGTDQTRGALPPAVTTAFEYGAVTLPPGKVVVVIDNVPATLIAKSCVADAPAVSTTRMVTLETPTVAGVPEIVPLLPLRLNPPGNVPVDTAHVSGAVPPVDAIVWEYAVPAVAAGREEVVIESGAPITILKGFGTEAPTKSVTVSVKLKVLAVVGVPEINPAAVSKFRPGGSAPAEMDQTSGCVPPAATTVLE